jgi:hypothetical protein
MPVLIFNVPFQPILMCANHFKIQVPKRLIQVARTTGESNYR